MKGFLQHRSKRWGYNGWAVKVKGASKPLDWTVSTTREEVRTLLNEKRDLLTHDTEIVKVKITVEVV